VTDVCYYTTSNLGEAAVAAAFSLQATSTTASNTRQRRNIDNFKVSTFTIGENSDIYIFSDYSRYTLFNQTGSINQFVFNPALLQPGREDGFLVTNFVQRQGLVKIYEALADGTVTEIIQAKKANNNVNIEEFFKQIVLTPVAPGAEFERNGNGSFQPVAGSIPVGILAASNEDSPRIIRAEELSGDGLIDVRELSPLSGYKSFSSPLTDDSGGTYWIYEPLDNDDSSVRFRANLIAYSQEFTLDLLPVNDAPTITSSGVYSFTRTGDNAPSSPSKPSDILTPPENPLSQTGINWSEVDDDFTPTFIPKKGLAITNVIALGTWQYSNDGGSNWANIGFVSETHALLIDESWSIRYVPDGQNAETAFFNFRAWDQTSGNAGQTANTSTNGGTSAYSTGIAKAQIIVDRINDPPVANPDVATAIEAGGLSNGTAGTDPTGNVLTNDTDVDNTNAELSVASFGTGAIPGSGSEGMDGDAALAGSYGELTLASNGAYTYTVDNTNATVQGLRTSSNTLTEVFNYTVRDPEGATDATTLTITITGANDNPVAVADTATAGEAGGIDNGTAGIDPTGNVLTNDTDVDSGDSKTVQSFRTGAIPGSGSEGMVGDAALAGSYGKLTLASNGTYTYTVTNTNPAVQALRTSSDTLTDSFNYTVVDAAGASDATTLIVTITGANDNPVAVADTASVVEAGGGTTPVNTAASSTTGDVFTNDTDVDEYNETKTVTAIRTGAPLGSGTAGSVGSALPGSFGSLTLASNGTYTYELNNTNAAVQALASAAATLTDTFTYTVADAAGATAAAALTVTITGVNDAPELNTAVSPSLISVTQNAPAPSNGSTAGSTLVSALVAGSSDVDAGAVKGIAITALNLQGGELRYSTDNGGTWRSLTTASETAALLLNSDATTRLYFQPAAGFTGSISNVFRFRAWDQTSGTAGQTANTSTNGGTSAFSTAIDDVAVTVSPLIWTETTKSSTTSLQGPEVFANVNFTSPPAGFVAYPIGLAMRGLTGTTASSVNLNTDGPTQDIRIGVANNTIDAGRNANSNETLILSLLQDARAIRLDFYGFGSTNSAGLDSGDTAQVTFSGVDNNGNRINVPTSTASTTISAGSLTAGPNGFNSRLLPIPTELAALRLPEIRIRATGGSFQLDYAVQVQADAITGTPGPDTLTGTLTRNIIHALAGDDNIIGGDGDDLIWAGSGSNNINGGLGSDVFGFQQFDSVPTSGATPFTNTILAPTTGAYGDRIYFRNASSVAAPVQISSAAGNNRWQATVNWGGTTTEIFEFLLPTGVSLTKGTGQAATPTSLTFF
jgi:VCBS repeat-containing protein